MQKEWVIENAKGDDAIGNEADFTEGGDGVARISFNRAGVYDIYYNVYLKIQDIKLSVAMFRHWWLNKQ